MQMKKFVIKILLFLLPILLIAVMVEFLLQHIPNDYSYKKNYMDNHSNEIQVLILGSSHPFYGINPIYFSKNTFNASYPCQSLDVDYKIFKRYQAEFNHLETIILSISYFTPFRNSETNNYNSAIMKNYVIYWGMDVVQSISDYSELLTNKLSVNVKNLKKYYLNKEVTTYCSDFGWGINYNSENAMDLDATGKDAALSHTIEDIYNDKYVKILNENINILNTMVEWCKKRNVKLILLATPVYKTYYDNMDKEQLFKAISIATQFAESYTNCEYINLLNDSIFVAGDFFDTNHLNDLGAKKLSELLNEKVNANQ
jgi:hypothetical protein